MDAGKTYTEKKTQKLVKQIEDVYAEAYQDISKKMDEFTSKFMTKNAIYTKKLQDGEITQAQYDNWLKGQVFQSDQWKLKKAQITKTIMNSNRIAAKMINGQSHDVFTFNANYTSYGLEHNAGINFGLGIYDEATVTKLIKDDPKLLPEWKINEKKDYVWNQKKLNNAVTQGIIQGESLDKISDRISKNLSMQNKNSSLTFARTAMTGAQNAGRDQSLMNAKAKGIKLVKQWMATFDARTRDTHAEIDGETIKVGDKWHPQKFSNGCRFPGDPEGPPHEVYNCRCTLVGDIEGYPEEFERYDNIDGKPVKDMTYKEWYEAKGLNKGKQATKKKAAKEAEKKYEKAKAELAKLEQKIKDVGADKTFENIWYNQTVTYADWESKKNSIQDKIDYYNKQIEKFQKNIDAGINDSAMLKKMQDKLDELKEFQKNGETYSKLYAERNALKSEVMALEPKPDPSKIFGRDAYSQERKDAAVWAKSPREADNALRSRTGEVWRDATKNEKEAIYEYTSSYSKFNEPLRGWEYGQSNYMTGAGFKGVGNTDLNAGYIKNGARLNAMTDILDKCTYDDDVWLQRGCKWGGMDKFFGVDMDLLQNGTQEELENALLGTTPTEFGFMSCGSSKGRGFSGNILLNIYAPSGTKMMYVEPFSAFGNGDELKWDGISEQTSFGNELETILQQGTQFRVVKVEKVHHQLYFDLEVINQNTQQRWKS